MTVVSVLLAWWGGIALLLWLWKGRLLAATWREPYFLDTPVLIESDDWGPGGDFHAERLERLTAMLERHADSLGRSPVFTADMVLAVPDTRAIAETGAYRRLYLDEGFPQVYRALCGAMERGLLVPQLHGLEHLNSDAFLSCVRSGDPRVQAAMDEPGWWDWESLDSPLQAHYVNGAHLPTRPATREQVESWVRTAQQRFRELFGAPSLTTVAPCYLWNDEVEAVWREQGIRAIQSAGYRCVARDAAGRYLQDPQVVRVGQRLGAGLPYLVRNVMYEPVDGRNTPETALEEALAARRQALPVTVSTHRYNYTREEAACDRSIEGLDRLLDGIERRLPRVRYLSSAELAQALETPEAPLHNPFDGSRWPPLARLRGMARLRPWMLRLAYRHPKLRRLALLTGLVLPLLPLLWVSDVAARLAAGRAGAES